MPSHAYKRFLAMALSTTWCSAVGVAAAAPRAPEPKAVATHAVAVARLTLPADAVHRGFRLRRQVTIAWPPSSIDAADGADPAAPKIFGELPLPIELRSAGPSPWRDLRLVAQPLGPSETAVEIPYVIVEEPKLLLPMKSEVPARLYFPLAVAQRGPRSPATPSTATQLTLYYGSNRARAPVYQLDVARVPPSPQTVLTAELSDEESNPRYQAIAGAPSPVAAIPLGASLSCYRMQHPIEGLAGADLYAVMLSPLTVGLSHCDFRDLLIIDADGRALPSVRTDDVGEGRIELAISDERTDEHGSEPKPAQLRYRLSASFGNEPLALPYRTLEIDLPDGAPEQTARLVERPQRTVSAAEVELWRGELPKDDGDRATPFFIPLPERGRRYTELVLELRADPGPPIGPARVVGVVPVPRLSFHSDGRPGAHLLLGCSPAATTTLAVGSAGPPSPSAPVTPTALLRKSESQLYAAVHDYGARRATLSPIEPHAAFRARQPSPSRSSASTAILWAGFLLLLGLLTKLSLAAKPSENTDDP